MNLFKKLFFSFCLGFFTLGLFACPQQQPAGESETVVEEEEVEVEVPVATPAP
jgi:hypothetical protein